MRFRTWLPRLVAACALLALPLAPAAALGSHGEPGLEPTSWVNAGAALFTLLSAIYMALDEVDDYLGEVPPSPPNPPCAGWQDCEQPAPAPFRPHVAVAPWRELP